MTAAFRLKMQQRRIAARCKRCGKVPTGSLGRFRWRHPRKCATVNQPEEKGEVIINECAGNR